MRNIAFIGWILVTGTALGIASSTWAIERGRGLPEIVLEGEQGGLVQGNSRWSSRSMDGQLQFVIYVDPDDHTLNDELIDQLRAQKYSKEQLASTAIINLAASWKPNAIILSILRGKQNEFPNTTYVFDRHQAVAKAWELPKEGYQVMLLDRDGTVLFEKAGKLQKKEIESFLDLVRLKVTGETQAKVASPAGDDPKKSL